MLMSTRQCVVCGESFERDGKRLVCSHACKRERIREQTKAKRNQEGGKAIH